MLTQTATATATEERLGLFSKLRSKLTHRRVSKPEQRKNDPYRKSRSMELGRQPFMSQPALVIRSRMGAAVDRHSSESDTPLSALRQPRTRSSFDGARHSSVLRFPSFGRMSKSASPTSPTATKTEVPRFVEGFPTQTEPVSPRAARLSANQGPRSELPPAAPDPTTPRSARQSTPSTVSFANTSPTSRTAASPPAHNQTILPQLNPIDFQPFTPTDVVFASTTPPDDAPSYQASGVTNTSAALPSAQLVSETPQAIQGLPTTADPILLGEASRSLDLARNTPTKPAAQPPTNPSTPPLTVDTQLPPIVLPPSLSRRGWQTGAHAKSVTESASAMTSPVLPITPTRSSGTLPSRSPVPHLGTMPARPLSRVQLGGGARLSPSITMRQPSMPIMTLPPLPPLPPPTPSESPRARPNSHTRLMSMPRLSMVGRSAEDDADHENAMLEESDEEEEGAGAGGERSAGSDDEDDAEYLSAQGSVHEEERPARADLSALKPSRILNGFAATTGGLLEGNATPRASRIMDYFSSKSPEKTTPRDSQSPMRTPRAADVLATPGPSRTPRVADVLATPGPSRTPALTRVVSPRFESPRPHLHHVASRSMVDLLSPRAERLEALTTKPDESPAISREPSQAEAAAAAPTLRRQTSMPTFNVSSPPPPYPAFPPHANRIIVVPREEEGREPLPVYANDIHLRAILPRKMEFAGPGVQAKDRKWRRVMCELHGTAFRVYKCAPGAAGVGSITGWWESKVGVGDLVGESGTGGGLATGATAGRIDIPRSTDGTVMERQPKGDGDNATSATIETAPAGPPAPQPPVIETRRSRLAATLLPSRSSRGRQSMDTTRDAAAASSTNLRRASMPPIQGGATSSTASSSRISSASASRPSVSSISHSSSSSLGKDVPEPDSKDLLRAYSLQNAESGLGSDYIKRKNVIRVRLEGEQFLLQAPDVATVVDWIEGFQAATNIALDLDERPMPRPPLFPRRRRRRARPTGNGSAVAATSSSGAQGDAATNATTAASLRR